MPTASAYLTVEEFKVASTMPSEDVDDLETRSPGWLANQLIVNSGRINARMSKRYAVPFTEPVPQIVKDWLSDIVTPLAFDKRGVNPEDPSYQTLLQYSKDAYDEMKETADSETGLFDLPLNNTAGGASAIVRGEPMAYSEPTPYGWLDEQRGRLR